MSRILPFTMEEILEWEEMELQKKKEDAKQFIERGLSINARHEKYRQMKAEMSKNIEVPAARELLAFTENPEPSHILDSAAKAEEVKLGEPKPQKLLTGSDPVNDDYLKSPRAIRPTGVDTSARSGFKTDNQDTDTPNIRVQAVERYLAAGDAYSTLSVPPRESGIFRTDGTSDPAATRNSESQQLKEINSIDSCGQQSHRRIFPAPSSIDRGEKYTQRISMYSPKSGNWYGLVARLDSGSKENWIVQSVVDRLKLKVVKGTVKRYSAFNNEEVCSDATVKATWCKGGGNTHEHIFRVIEKAPFQVLFGTNLLDSDEIKWFRKETVSDDVLVLTQTEVDKKEQEEINRTEKLVKEESAMLANKSQAIRRDGKIPTATPKSKPKPKDPDKKVRERKDDAKKSK